MPETAKVPMVRLDRDVHAALRARSARTGCPIRRDANALLRIMLEYSAYEVGSSRQVRGDE
ncbi:MAG: hypothetical protein KKH61_07545 [Gammaproteobacteria bacterium]|nr:hypothetical protein [Gammaproteobacteria bacterium]